MGILDNFEAYIEDYMFDSTALIDLKEDIDKEEI